MNIRENIIEDFCEIFKDKINENETYDEFISSFTKEKIEKVYKVEAVMDDNPEKLSHIISMSDKPKKVIVEEYKNNIQEIYSDILMKSPEEFIKQLEAYLKIYKDKVLKQDVFNLEIPLHYIDLLRTYNIAKIKYEKEENKLYFYTPKELRNILNKIIKNKKIKKLSKENSIYAINIHNLISTYGIIPVKELSKIYNKVYGKTNTDELHNRIIFNYAFNDEIEIIETDEGPLAYYVGLGDEDEALSFYYSLPTNIDYKEYSIEEYEEIGEGIYHLRFDELDELYMFLEVELDIEEDEMYEFEDIFISDYMYAYQIDSDEAKRNLNLKLNRFFKEIDFSDKAYLTSTILSLAKNYPNFNYKGYSYNEYKNINKK